MCTGSSSTACLSQLSACSQGGVLAGAVLGLIYVFQEKLVCALYFHQLPLLVTSALCSVCSHYPMLKPILLAA